MGTRSRSAGAFTAAAAAAVLLAVADPASAATGVTSTTTLSSLTGFSSVVADSVHQRLFVSGTGSDPVAVTDFTGAPVSTLSALDGATALALSSNSGILYAAIGGTDEIAAVDTSTLQEMALYFTGSGHDPQHLAVVGGDIWFGYGSSGQSGIGVLDPAALTVKVTAESAFYNAPLLSAAASAPTTLVAGAAGLSPSVVEDFDVSSGAPVEIAESDPWTQSDGCSNLNQLAVAASGTDVVTACGTPQHGSSLALSTLTEDATYATGPFDASVAVAPSTGTIAMGVYSVSSSVYLFTPGVSAPTSSVTLTGFGTYGLAWSADGTRLFAVSTSNSASVAPKLSVIGVS